MKNVISITISLMTMVSLMLVASCSNEVEDLIPETATTESAIWTEPYHVKGALPEDVKNFMTSSRKDLTLTELSSASCIQLMYSSAKSKEGIIYSFLSLDRTLYSIIDTEPISKWHLVEYYLQEHYTSLSLSSTNLFFTNSDRSVIINMAKVSDEYFNLSYDFTR